MTAEKFIPSLLEDLGAWKVFASGQAEGQVSRGADGGLKLDYDFHEGGGFVALRRELEFAMPESYELGFDLSGSGAKNDFEFKLADQAGVNVWRHRREPLDLGREPLAFRVCERDLPFAWGPAGGGTLSAVGAVEFVVTATEGGRGSLEISNPWFEDQSLRLPLEVSASSGANAALVLNNESGTHWQADANDAAPWWVVDFGKTHRFGGLLIEWPKAGVLRDFEVLASNDGRTWSLLRRVTNARGAKNHLAIPGAETRFLKLEFADSESASLRRLQVKPDAFSRLHNDFIHHVAEDFPRGWFPRYWHREQSYWTVIGTPEGGRRALINEEGLIETDEGAFSIEPFIVSEEGLLTWADVSTSIALPDGGEPMPSVMWHAKGLSLEILPWLRGNGRSMELCVNYRLQCDGAQEGIKLILALRPYQVTPPWQAFRHMGGRTTLQKIECDARGILADGKAISFFPHASNVGAATFDEGGVLTDLAQGKAPQTASVNDEYGLASAAIEWMLAPGETKLEVEICVPYFESTSAAPNHSWDDALSEWQKVLGGVEWHVPDAAKDAIATLRSACAQIMINRDGAALQPGARRYTRSWIRDGVIMGATLAKCGLAEPFKRFMEWYAPFQRDDGFVFCVVDRDGADPLVEHDSHGQFIWGMREAHRATGDFAFVEACFDRVARAADHLIALRRQRMSEHYRNGELAACFGLLPESASHEGYLAHPVHSYWDDFWAVRGLQAAAELAKKISRDEQARLWKKEADEFLQDLIRSIESVIATRNLNYIPGSVEWADFDPTATANAVAQLDFADALPQGPLQKTFETYLTGFRRRQDPKYPWTNYSAYEIRIIGALVRLGKRAEANELLDFFLADRRPREWNQWPEISWRDPRSPGHLGDLPHTWIAAEYVIALISMIASERESDDSLMLAAGMPCSWISGDGFEVRGLLTRYGKIDFRIAQSDHDTIDVCIKGLREIPAGGLWIEPPLPSGKRIDGAPADGKRVEVNSLPYVAKLKLLSLREGNTA
ncbi:MAG: hypothetical protein RLZ22_695 [Verrucomicrobiota bacterium]|jgi:hypothetical protein